MTTITDDDLGSLQPTRATAADLGVCTKSVERFRRDPRLSQTGEDTRAQLRLHPRDPAMEAPAGCGRCAMTDDTNKHQNATSQILRGRLSQVRARYDSGAVPKQGPLF